MQARYQYFSRSPVYRAAGAKSVPTLGADSNTGEDALANLVVGAVVPAAPAQVLLGPLIELLRAQGLVGMLRHRPGVPGN